MGFYVEGLRIFGNHPKNVSDVIVANRLSDELRDVKDKVYTRDVFSRD